MHSSISHQKLNLNIVKSQFIRTTALLILACAQISLALPQQSSGVAVASGAADAGAAPTIIPPPGMTPAPIADPVGPGAVVDWVFFSGYPALDVAPAPKQEWVDKYLKGATIPNIPVNLAPLDATDWSPDVTTCPDVKTWALTYDDGPGPFTNELLDKLKSYNIKTTFFVVGSRVAENLQQAQTLLRAYNEGHQICIHTWSHTAISTQSNEAIVAEVMWTGQIIQQVIGVFPRYFRPPYGDIDPRSRAVLKAMGLEIIIWNEDTDDWLMSDYPTKVLNGVTPEKVQATVDKWLASPPTTNGIISLEHDLWQYTEGAAITIVDKVMKAGYKVMPVQQCINGPSMYMDGTSAAPVNMTVNSSTMMNGTATAMKSSTVVANATASVGVKGGQTKVAKATSQGGASTPGYQPGTLFDNSDAVKVRNGRGWAISVLSLLVIISLL
ncbi:chitin deacetylase [Blyttiomyces sp. JEL0837]|nr:chitin deacetylase [Blyttiomyces sp. JEL0837]